jgi:hypothetical protein
MSSIASITPAAAQTNSTDSATAGLGLPPVGLAQAASVNTVNAALVSSAFGIDASAVSGVYGGSGASGSNWFTNVELLPALNNLSKATAEQALALFGIETPTPGGSADGTYSGTTTGAAGAAGNTAIPASATLGAAVVDPLWGKNA